MERHVRVASSGPTERGEHVRCIERLLAAALAGAVVIAGCSGGGSSIEPIGGDDQGATAPDGEIDAPEPDEPAHPGEPDDPFAVPDEIDVDYAQRVFDELFRLEAEVYNDVLETGVPDDGLIPLEQLEPLRDISANEEIFAVQVDLLQDAARNDFANLVQPVRPLDFQVAELRRADEQCVAARGDVDFTATAVEPVSDLLPHEFLLARSDRNVTGWALLEFSVLAEEFEGFDLDEVCP